MVSVTNEIRLFRLANQRSEIKRLLLLCGIVTVLFAGILVRYYAGGKIIRGAAFVEAMGFLGVIFIYALINLWFVSWANRSERLLSPWFWTCGVISESLLPTFALFCLVSIASVDPLQMIAAPAVLLYGIFITANILRLNPKLSLLFGTLAALGHVCVIRMAVQRTGGVEQSLMPLLASYPSLIFITGCVAAFVSRELRHHMVDALEAMDLRRRTELLRGELRIAREIQQTLFPKEKLNIPGFEVVGWCKPATETSGDYYDWCKLPSREGFVMLGDATGHGLGPALLIASCRAYVRADLPQNNDLAGFMSRLNERLSHDTSGSRYVTFVGTLLDEQTGQVKVMSAGHCPAFLVRVAKGKIDQIKAHGVPLGVMAGQSYPEAESLELQPGDRLVIYTDGITEAKRANGEMFGGARFMEAILRHAGLEGQSFIDALYKELSGFLCGAGIQDDLTILSVRRL